MLVLTRLVPRHPAPGTGALNFLGFQVGKGGSLCGREQPSGTHPLQASLVHAGLRWPSGDSDNKHGDQHVPWVGAPLGTLEVLSTQLYPAMGDPRLMSENIKVQYEEVASSRPHGR